MTHHSLHLISCNSTALLFASCKKQVKRANFTSIITLKGWLFFWFLWSWLFFLSHLIETKGKLVKLLYLAPFCLSVYKKLAKVKAYLCEVVLSFVFEWINIRKFIKGKKKTKKGTSPPVKLINSICHKCEKHEYHLIVFK